MVSLTIACKEFQMVRLLVGTMVKSYALFWLVSDEWLFNFKPHHIYSSKHTQVLSLPGKKDQAF